MWRFDQFKPQKARATLKESMWTDPDYYLEEKFDGFREISQFCGSVVRFTSGVKSKKDGLFVEKTDRIPHLSGYTTANNYSEKLIEPPADLTGTVLDGEMIIPEGFVTGAGGRSRHVGSIIGSDADVAIMKQIERGWLRYAVFDCLFYQGVDLRMLPLFERKSYLELAMRLWNNPYAFMVPWYNDNKKARLDDIYAAGGEGVILKHKEQKYGDIFQGHLKWAKVKQFWNADVIITGFKPAKEMSKKVTGEITATKYAEEGLIGAIEFSQYRDGQLWECGFTSGFDEDLRRDISANPEAFLGKVIVIKHYGREPTGRFRHPQYVDFRTDKPPEDCQYLENEV